MTSLQRRTTTALIAVALTLPLSLQAAEPAERLAESLAVNGQAMPVERVRETPVAGLFEVQLESGEIFYTNAEGSHFLVGDLYENSEGGLVNLTERERSGERLARLAEVPASERVVFEGEGEVRATVVVFTDTTCPYCQRFHEEVPRLNAMGIDVHYLAFPRAGMNGEGARQLRQVWCADDRAAAMTAAKRGEPLESSTSCDNPVTAQYDLGREVGVEGTPAIVLPDGRLVPGYVPAERLAGMIAND